MIDLRNLTDYEREQYFACNIPRWVYFVAAGAAVLVALWIAAPIVIGTAMGIWR